MQDKLPYPAYDETKADLLVCPLTGKPILRAKNAAEAEQARVPDVDLAEEHTLQRAGPSRVWTAKT